MKIDGGFNVLNTITPLSEKNSQTAGTDTRNSFGQFFDAAMNIVQETNYYQQEADKIQLDYASGKSDNMLSVMLAQEKAYASLNFTVQITNKVIEAYREIMRIQV